MDPKSLKLIGRKEVLERFGGKSVSWLYQEIAAGRMPRPVKTGRQSVAWLESEIDQRIATAVAERDAKTPAKAA